ncbi:MAG: rhomboid family intramembrane serine protease [Proteobacteria bacterium]|nr:MAG: rhomboid family intramembrane serine protease [Pseudomonadota bacterium]
MKNYTHTVREELKSIVIFVALIWIVFAADIFLPLERLGLIPRDTGGLVGIVTMTFLHSDLAHLMSNIVPLIVMLALLAGSRANSLMIVGLIIVIGGALLWLFGRSNTLHIGASLLVFGLATFLIVSGFLEKRIVPMIISVFVLVTYGGVLITGIAPWQEGVSWDGHLFGGIGGAITAWLLLGRGLHKVLP